MRWSEHIPSKAVLAAAVLGVIGAQGIGRFQDSRRWSQIVAAVTPIVQQRCVEVFRTSAADAGFAWDESAAPLPDDWTVSMTDETFRIDTELAVTKWTGEASRQAVFCEVGRSERR